MSSMTFVGYSRAFLLLRDVAFLVETTCKCFTNEHVCSRPLPTKKTGPVTQTISLFSILLCSSSSTVTVWRRSFQMLSFHVFQEQAWHPSTFLSSTLSEDPCWHYFEWHPYSVPHTHFTLIFQLYKSIPGQWLAFGCLVNYTISSCTDMLLYCAHVVSRRESSNRRVGTTLSATSAAVHDIMSAINFRKRSSFYIVYHLVKLPAQQ